MRGAGRPGRMNRAAAEAAPASGPPTAGSAATPATSLMTRARGGGGLRPGRTRYERTSSQHDPLKESIEAGLKVSGPAGGAGARFWAAAVRHSDAQSARASARPATGARAHGMNGGPRGTARSVPACMQGCSRSGCPASGRMRAWPHSATMPAGYSCPQLLSNAQKQQRMRGVRPPSERPAGSEGRGF